MHPRTLLTGAVLCAAMLCRPAAAATIVSIAGPVTSSVGLGLAPQQQIGAVQFTVATGITGGSVVVELESVSSSSVTAWITNAIGSGATSANVIATNVFPVGVAVDQQYTALTNVTLSPGTYYLVLEGVSQVNNPVGWWYTTSPVVTGTVNAAELGAIQAAPFPFGPSGSFSAGTGNFLFQLTGTQTSTPPPSAPSPTPAPSTAVLVLTAIACLGLWSAVGYRKRQPV